MMLAPVVDFPELVLRPEPSPFDLRSREEHRPYRPNWFCRIDSHPWPCATARLLLNAAYADNRAGLTIFMAGMLYNAMRDLYRLNPDDGPAPYTLFTRFVSWTEHARSARL